MLSVNASVLAEMVTAYEQDEQGTVTCSAHQRCAVPVSFRQQRMHDVPKLMKERDAVRVSQQRWAAGLSVGCREVAQHAVDGGLAVPPLQQVENGRMSVSKAVRISKRVNK